jgi:DNA-binding transcriptional LysR family regulator
MDLWQLKVFSSVVEEKSFSRASRRLNLPQPTVSSHIRDLEAHFGCRLVVPLALLLREPFIAREPGSGTRAALEEALARAGGSLADLRVVSEIGGTHAVIQAVRSGLGVSILSRLAVAEEVAAGRLACLRVENLELRRCCYLTRLRRRTLSPLGMRFMDFLRGHPAVTRASRRPPEA